MSTIFTVFAPAGVSREDDLAFTSVVVIWHGNSIASKQIYFSSGVVYIDERTCTMGCERIVFSFEACNTAFSITNESFGIA